MFVPRYPLHLVFILSNRCNLRCVHCSSAAGESAPGELARAEIERVLDDLARLGVVDLAFSGGEPLLRRDLPELVAGARERGLRVGTSTNGWPLTAAVAERLARAGLSRLQVSLDGPEPVHDRIRGPGSFARAVAAIRHSIAAGLRTHICFTAMAENQPYLGEIIDLAADLGVQGFNLSQFVPVGRGGCASDLRPVDARAVLQTWTARRDRYGQMDFRAHLAGLVLVDPRAAATAGFIGCQAGIHIACITAVGDVTPCVMFPLALGNLRERSFAEIWDTAPAIRDLRARSLTGACGGCEHCATCGGCRAAAYVYTGDHRADDPRCWLLPGGATTAPAEPPKKMESTCRTSLSIVPA